MSVSPFAQHLPLSFDEDSDLFEGDFDEYGEDLDDFGDEDLDDFDDEDLDDFGDEGIDAEIDDIEAEMDLDNDMDDFGAEDDEDDDEGDDSDLDDLDADLDSLGGDEFGIAMRNIRMTSTAKLRKIVTGRWRRKKVRMAALKEIMRRERRRSRGRSSSSQPASSYYQQEQYYQQPQQQYYQPQQHRYYPPAPRHSTGERQTFSPQQEVARQQAAARRLHMRKQAQDRANRRAQGRAQGRANVLDHKRNRASALREARRNAARRQQQAARRQQHAAKRDARRNAARKSAAMRRMQREQRPGVFARRQPSPLLASNRMIPRFGVDAAPPGFTLQPKLGSAMWQHKFATLAVLGGMYAIGAYVGKERTMDALGPIGDGFENLGRRIRTARA